MNHEFQRATIGYEGVKPGKGAIAQVALALRMLDDAIRECDLLDEPSVALLSDPNRASGQRVVASWLRQHKVFSLDLPDLGVRYPAFQFRADGSPWPVLADVLPLLQGAFQPFDLLIWFNSPHPALRGHKPRSCLAGHDRVLAAVKNSLTPLDFY
jgi:hypothetical protein